MAASAAEPAAPPVPTSDAAAAAAPTPNPAEEEEEEAEEEASHAATPTPVSGGGDSSSSNNNNSSNNTSSDSTAKLASPSVAAATSSTSVTGGGGGGGGGSGAGGGKKDSYEYQRVLGYGSYSRVVRAVQRQTKVTYAVKIVSKVQIQMRNELQCVISERDILKQCDHPNVIKLVETFQSPDELFYVMEHAAGGELLSYIKRVGRFNLHIVKHVTAEIVNTLEYLHSKGIVHRDLKPENLLLDARNHIKLVDFGTAYMQKDPKDAPPIMEIHRDSKQGTGSVNMPPAAGQGVRGQTFCGTFQYISPELLDQGVTTTASDLWAMGCIVYQMAAGHRPFDDGSVMLIFDKIRNPEKHLLFSPDFPAPVRDLVSHLLVTDPKARLGCPEMGGYPPLKAHALFEGIDFAALPTQELAYQWKPTAPVWVSDEAVSTCRACNALFTLTNRRHHCRKCGDIFCKSCSKHQTAIPGLYTSKVCILPPSPPFPLFNKKASAHNPCQSPFNQFTFLHRTTHNTQVRVCNPCFLALRKSTVSV